MRRRIVFAALLALAIVQLAVPLGMIAKRRDTLANGQLFRFRTAPVDPYDAFRGRYVALALEHDAVPVASPEEYLYGQRIFVRLEVDDEGFARPTGISRERPSGGAYLEARVAGHGRTGREVRIRYPFDRYYMNEELAPAAERAYLEHSRPGERDAWVEVRVHRGFAVLEELFVGGVPIGEFLARGR